MQYIGSLEAAEKNMYEICTYEIGGCQSKKLTALTETCLLEKDT